MRVCVEMGHLRKGKGLGGRGDEKGEGRRGGKGTVDGE